jgi:hypothetical protein
MIPGYTQPDGTPREDEYRAVFGLWLTAFPQTGLNMRHSK